MEKSQMVWLGFGGSYVDLPTKATHQENQKPTYLNSITNE